MRPVDDRVYLVPGGKDYAALFADGWLRWPAHEHGWAERHPCPASLVNSCSGLEPKLAALALRLSGADGGSGCSLDSSGLMGDRGRGTASPSTHDP